MILFENVTKKYRGTQRPALDTVELRIDRGEFVFIVGASGSGKSSCLQLILREEQPSGGRVHVLGHDLGRISNRKVPYFRRNLGVVFQDFRLLTNKNVYDNVAFSLQVIGKSRGFIQEAVPDTLALVGLEGKSKRFPHELSGGEQQRVAIARAIVNKPAILLADEPTGNLDPATSLGIMQLLRAINAAGTTVVMATHEATFVDIMQQRVVELSQGVVVRDEQRGGYGETASIPIADLSEAGLQTLRASEDLVRATLAPAAGGPSTIREAERTVPVAEEATGRIEAEAVDHASEAAEIAGPPAGSAAGSPSPTLATMRAAEPDPPVEPALSPEFDAEPSGAAGAGEADPGVNEHAAHSEDDELDRTVRAERPDGRRGGASSDPIDPLRLSEGGSLAQRLGLSERRDDETDVGPVR